MATVNVAILKGQYKALADQLKRHPIKIDCIQETKGAISREIEDGQKVFCYGTSKERNGAAFAVVERFRDDFPSEEK